MTTKIKIHSKLLEFIELLQLRNDLNSSFEKNQITTITTITKRRATQFRIYQVYREIDEHVKSY